MPRQVAASWLLLAGLLALAGCASTPAPPPGAPGAATPGAATDPTIPAAGVPTTTADVAASGDATAEHRPAALPVGPLEQVPFHPQELHQCGPAALATLLGASGLAADPLQLADQVYVPGRRGSFQAELIAATRRAGRVPWQVDGTLDALAAEVAAGRPVLVLQNLALPAWPRWHYAVVIGVDAERVTLRSGKRRSLRMSRRAFLRSWEWAGHWGFVALRPGEWPARPEPRRWVGTMSDLEQLGQRAVARQGLEAATRRWPEESLAWFALGNARYRARELPGARDAWLATTRLAPGFAPGWNNLAQVLGELGCPEAAHRAIARARAATIDDAGRRAVDATERGLASVATQPASSTASACSSDSGTP